MLDRSPEMAMYLAVHVTRFELSRARTMEATPRTSNPRTSLHWSVDTDCLRATTPDYLGR